MKRLLISSGEASGELYGAQLIEALYRRHPTLEFFGVGGGRMRVAGCNTVVDAHQIAVVGLAEVVTHLPRIYAEFNKLMRAVDAHRPDAAILIDFPEFNLRLARKLHQRGIPIIYYVSPQLWAWRPGRVKQIRKYVRTMLVIFPFEVEFYRRHGVEAEFVGHPLADQPKPEPEPHGFATQHGLDEEKTWIALLPGSRKKEVALNLPVLLESAARLQTPDRDFQFLLPVAPTLSPQWIKSLGFPENADFRLTHDARATLAHARAAVVASGTATVEAALIGTPFVMVYRLSSLTYTIGRPLVKLDRFAMPNLIAGHDVVTELVQSDFTPEKVVAELRKILPDGPARQQMLAGFAEVQQKLHPAGSFETAANRAADAVLRALGS